MSTYFIIAKEDYEQLLDIAASLRDEPQGLVSVAQVTRHARFQANRIGHLLARAGEVVIEANQITELK